MIRGEIDAKEEEEEEEEEERRRGGGGGKGIKGKYDLDKAAVNKDKNK